MLTETGGNLTLTMIGATQSGAVNLSDNATARTLTTQVDSGTSTISGVIANGGGSTGSGLTKTGAGTLVLAGNNTYTGTTTISNGTIQLAASNRLADTSAMNIGASGALNLNGFSEKIGALTAAGGATIDFGAAGGNNTFVFGTYTPPASGVLVVNNWVSGSDTLATTVATASQGTNGSQNINNSIYISGYGLATEATTLSTTIYGTNSAYLLTPAAQTWKYWDGTTTNWAGANYWSSTASPTFTTTGTPNGTGVLVDIGNFNTGVSATTDSTANKKTITYLSF
jgi:fibronectin-binding autotransporter adhesin